MNDAFFETTVNNKKKKSNNKILKLIKGAPTGEINNREVFMKEIDYYYEEDMEIDE